MSTFKGPVEQRLFTRKKILSAAIGSALTLLLAGCGGGGGGGSSSSSGTGISGSGVNSPLINAIVEAYKIDLTTGDVAVSPIATGTTGTQAQIQGLSLPFPISPPYLLKFKVHAGTTIPGGGAPELKELNTLILSADKAVYATAISSMAVLMANNSYQDYVKTAGNENKGSLALYESFVDKATNTVKDTLGYGLLPDSFNIFTTSPMIDSDSATSQEISNAVLYRTAANAAVKTVVKLAGASGGDQTTDIISSLAADLEDGAIDGINDDGAVVYTADSGTIDNNQVTSFISQVIAEADQIEDVVALLNQEKAETGGGSAAVASQSAQELVVKFVADADDDGIPDNIDEDSDNDGFNDTEDALPLNANEWLDTDGDGQGNNQDSDDDGDGVADTQDDFPLDSSKSSAEDQDNDGWPAEQDADDQNAANPGTAFLDTDGDGVGDTTDPDIDGDGVVNAEDAFDYNSLEWSDIDTDGVDNSLTTDGNGTGDNSDPDIDGDSVLNGDDIDPYDASISVIEDLDNDGIADDDDLDIDGDGLLNDDDGVGGAHKDNPDRDGDGTKDGLDNCVDLDNADQLDANNNDIGAVCELPPSANSISDKQTIFNDPISITLSGVDGSDSTDDELSYQVSAASINGNVVINGDQAVYTPNTDFTGDDSFEFTASDGENNSAGVTVNINVNPQLVLSGTPSVQTHNGASYTFSVSASGGAGAGYTYSLSGNPGWMSIDQNGVVSGIPSVPDVGAISEIVITIEDANGATTIQTFNLIISLDTDLDGIIDGVDNCVNTPNTDQLDLNTNVIGALCEAAPTATDLNLTALIGEGLQVVLVGVDGDQGTDTLQYSIETQPTKGTLTGSGVNLLYLASNGSTGTDSFTYKVSDAEHDSEIATVNLTINTKPTLSATPIETATVGVSYSFQVTAADPDGDDLNYSLEGAPSWMSIDDAGLVSGIPPTDSDGETGDIIIKVDDGRGGEVALVAFVVTVSANSNSTLMNWNADNWNSANWQ